MKTSTKALFMLLVFLAPVLSAYVLLRVNIYVLKKEIKHALKLDSHNLNLVTLRISAHEELEQKIFKRIHSKEFSYNNAYYDIVQSYKTGDETVYTCYLDSEESILHLKCANLLADFLDDDSEDKNSKRSFIKKFLELKVKMPSYNSIEISCLNYKKCALFAGFCTYKFKHSRLINPPPED